MERTTYVFYLIASMFLNASLLETDDGIPFEIVLLAGTLSVYWYGFDGNTGAIVREESVSSVPHSPPTTIHRLARSDADR